jgi:hypothetical protein
MSCAEAGGQKRLTGTGEYMLWNLQFMPAKLMCQHHQQPTHAIEVKSGI